MTARELAQRIARREISPVEATRRALAKAEATQESLNSFFLIMSDQALESARAAEAAVMRGVPLGPLHGVPFSAKDLVAVGGVPFCFGSRTMAGNVAAADAPAVERTKQAGAILIGKTTTSEFGCKAVGDSPLTGVTRNPWNLEHTPDGSPAPFYYLAELSFEDADELQAAMGSPEGQAAGADVANFATGGSTLMIAQT